MRRIALALLRAYLGLFAFFAPNREHARNEHRLLEGSISDAYRRYRRAGVARTPAAWEGKTRSRHPRRR